MLPDRLDPLRDASGLLKQYPTREKKRSSSSALDQSSHNASACCTSPSMSASSSRAGSGCCEESRFTKRVSGREAASRRIQSTENILPLVLATNSCAMTGGAAHPSLAAHSRFRPDASLEGDAPSGVASSLRSILTSLAPAPFIGSCARYKRRFDAPILHGSISRRGR